MHTCILSSIRILHQRPLTLLIFPHLTLPRDIRAPEGYCHMDPQEIPSERCAYPKEQPSPSMCTPLLPPAPILSQEVASPVPSIPNYIPKILRHCQPPAVSLAPAGGRLLLA